MSADGRLDWPSVQVEGCSLQPGSRPLLLGFGQQTALFVVVFNLNQLPMLQEREIFPAGHMVPEIGRCCLFSVAHNSSNLSGLPGP